MKKVLILFDGIEKWCERYVVSSGGTFITLVCHTGHVYPWDKLEEIEKEYQLTFVYCSDFGTATNFTFRIN